MRDCNGRTIKAGDRVRIIADECNKFMRGWWEEDWIPEMHWEADVYGTASITPDGLQVVDERGEMLWDLEWKHNLQDPCLEVVKEATE